MTASTSGTGPRSKARESAIDRRRQEFDEYVTRMLTDPPVGSTWHPLYRWPSDTDEEYAARVATTNAHRPPATRPGRDEER